jgi:hypothetical protein
MFKDKLKNWGFSKNYTAKRVRDLLHQRTVKDAVGKVSTFGGDREERNIQKIKKYLKRRNMTLQEFIETEDEGHVGVDAISTIPSQVRTLYDSDVDLSIADSQSTEIGYEYNCPYRPWAKKFRLVENFPR